MKYNSLVLKVLFWLIALVILFYLAVFLLYVPKLKKDNINLIKKNNKNLTEAIEFSILDKILNEKYREMDDYIKSISKNMDVRITIIKPDGSVLSDSNENPAFMDNHKDRIEIAGALKGRASSSIRYSKTLKKNMIYIAEPLIYENNIIAAIRTSTFIGDVNKIIGKYVYNIVFFSLIAVLISIGAILFIYYTFKNTVSKFSFFSKSVAKGDFDIKLKLKENYENSELEKSFNNMTNKLKDLFQDLSNEKEELNSIISSVKEGIMVIDKDGIVVRVNESFKSICKDKNPISKYYWELLRIENIDKIFNRVDSETKNYNTEVEINGRDYLLSVNYIFLKREIVIIFHDITEIKEFEKSKKDLASNVSHELNTPLAAIKGYVETLIDEETDRVKLQRLKVVENHMERLINIVKDLLLLSSVDEKKVDFDDNVDISTVVSNSIRIFDMKIKEKNLNLKFFPEPDIPQIKGDAFKIEQVIINLIDNAIKYTEKGSISIHTYSANNEVFFKIEDTGIGIPEKDLKKVFDRFYVVDKSRSKNNGGTGLGLSIVKNIVLSHNGIINIDSKIGKGTSFTVIFPVSQKRFKV